MMTSRPRITFIGAGSKVFLKNILVDALGKESLKRAEIALMDIDPKRLAEAEAVARTLNSRLGTDAVVSTHLDQREALAGADFVILSFQIGGYEPCTVTDFEVPKKYGLRQTIADTLGVGGIMRGLRTVPHLWKICEDMTAVCPDALMLQYVNPMAINMWAIADRYPHIRTVGLCHSVQGTASELARDLDIPVNRIRYDCAGINHMAFYLRFEEVMGDGSFRDLYPDLRAGYADGRIPKPNSGNPRCPNQVRYDMMTRLGYFVTESSEHFAEYVPWFIKNGRQDLIKRYGIPLDEYPMRCTEQTEKWNRQALAIVEDGELEIKQSHEFAAGIMNSVLTGSPTVIHGNVKNTGLITTLPESCVVEVPCVVDRNGVQPVHVGALPPQLTSIIRTNINVQELTVAALINEDSQHIYHAAMMDPHTGAELDLDQIWDLVDDLLTAHGDWLPEWTRSRLRKKAA